MSGLSSTELDQLASALAKAQGEMPVVKFDKQVSFQNVQFEYASLSNILEVSKPILAKHQLSLLQFPSTQDGYVQVETLLLHASGQKIVSQISAKISKPDDPKQLGSWITYLRRYSLSAVLGISSESDEDATDISERYTGSPEQKVWLRGLLTSKGLDVTAMKKVSDEMISGSFEATEKDVAKALEVLRR